MSSPSAFIQATGTNASLEGAYLYYDKDNKKWIQSGKVVGSDKVSSNRTFETRHQDHVKAIKNVTMDSSRFYQLYPSRTMINDVINITERRGYSENLVQYCAIGFDRKQQIDAIVNKNDGI